MSVRFVPHIPNQTNHIVIGNDAVSHGHQAITYETVELLGKINKLKSENKQLKKDKKFLCDLLGDVI